MNDIEYSKMRFENILESHKLNYNPYKVLYIQGVDSWGNFRNAYSMQTLSGDMQIDSKIIRTETYKSKIKMLQRLFQYPECSDYIFCIFSLIWYCNRSHTYRSNDLDQVS